MFDYRRVENPYPGLRPFEPHEGEIFFGRDSHIDSLLEILQRERFLAVVGPSGCGKSSLVRAGLLPALAAGRLGTGSNWRLAVFRPGGRPLLALAQALIGGHALGSELLGDAAITGVRANGPITIDDVTADAALIAAELRTGTAGLDRVLDSAVKNRRIGTQTPNLLILVDQFEELFTYHDTEISPNEAEHFVNLLLAASCRGITLPRDSNELLTVHVVLTMRTDFLGHCVAFGNLPQALNRALFLTPRLRQAELRAAIRGPAALFGGSVDDEFVDEIVQRIGVNSDHLPLLQHALARWWREAQKAAPSQPCVAANTSVRAGDVDQALDWHAEEVFGAMSRDEQFATETLFRAITGSAEGAAAVRRPLHFVEVATWGEIDRDALHRIIRVLAAPDVSFINHSHEQIDRSIIDIAHEALLRKWTRLRNWIDDELRRGLGYVQWLTRSAEYGYDGTGLLNSADLARAMDWWNPVADRPNHWRNGPHWAARYSNARGADALALEFDQLRTFLLDSCEAERRKRERELAKRQREAEAALQAKFDRKTSLGDINLSSKSLLGRVEDFADGRGLPERSATPESGILPADHISNNLPAEHYDGTGVATAHTLQLFLISPSDTAGARQVIADAVAAFNANPLYRARIRIEIRRWSDVWQPGSPADAAIGQTDLAKYAMGSTDCDLVVVLVRHHLGSPLPEDHFGLSPNGDAWTTTEWEIDRALAPNGNARAVWIYRDGAAFIDDKGLTLSERDHRWQQFRRVQEFFEGCLDTRRAVVRGFNIFDDVANLGTLFSAHLRGWVDIQLNANVNAPKPGPLLGELAEPMNAAQLRLLDTLRVSDEPLDRNLVQAIPNAPVQGLRGYLMQRIAYCCIAGSQLHRQFVNLDVAIDQGPGSPGKRFEPHERYATLQAVLDSTPGVRGWVLLGEPGSGKSTLLQHHEILMARSALRVLDLGETLTELCIWQRLSEFPHDVLDVAAWLEAQWQTRYPSLPPLAKIARMFRLRWLLDGLNEINAPDASAQRAAVLRWTNWLASLSDEETSAPIFSVRNRDCSSALTDAGLRVCQIYLAPWSEEQIETYCTLRLGPGNTLWSAIREDPAQLSLCALPFNLAAQCDLAAQFGRPAADRAELLSAMVWQRLRRAVRRHELGHPDLLTKREIAMIVDETYWLDHIYQLPTDGSLVTGLDRQAIAMQRASGGFAVSVGSNEVATWLTPEARSHWFEAVETLQIAEVDGDGNFRFKHQLLQEFHVARGLRGLPCICSDMLPDLSAPPLEPLSQTLARLGEQDSLPSPSVSIWEEPVKLAAQMAALNYAGVDDPDLRLIEHLLPINLALAGRAARQCHDRLRATAGGNAFLRTLCHTLLQRSCDAEVDLRHRIEAAEVLGFLGDPRYQEGRGAGGQRYIVPNSEYWIQIPSGRYTIGEPDGDADEAPMTVVDLIAFCVAFAPVTNAEFGCFVDAGGYEDERWWLGSAAQLWRREGIQDEQSIATWLTLLKELRDDFQGGVMRYFPGVTDSRIEMLGRYAAWSEEEAKSYVQVQFGKRIYRAPEYWENSQFNLPCQPVVGVTLFEAQAYACWLSSQTGQMFRLPVEAEWEAAARGRHQRHWPWGEHEPGTTQINADPAHLRRTSPVGVFPLGNTSEGVTDMAGNVFEWTTSAHMRRIELAAPMTNTRTGLARRSARGGSWGNPAEACRIGYRYPYSPDARFNMLGFRLVRAQVVAAH